MIRTHQWRLSRSGSGKFRTRARGRCTVQRGLGGRGQVCGWTENGQGRQTVWRHSTEKRRSGNYERLRVFWKNADPICMMTWWNATITTTTTTTIKHSTVTQNMERRLEHRSRVVTTLPHLQEISSRDLGMAPEKSGRWICKTKLLLWQMSETTNLKRLKTWNKEHNRV